MTEDVGITRTQITATAIVVACALAAAGLVVGVLALLTRDTRQDIRLSELGGTSMTAMRGIHENTAEVCAHVPGCVEGASSDHVDLRRFDSLETAEAYAHAVADAHQSQWLVIEYTDAALSAADRDDLRLYVDGLAHSDG